MFVCDGFLWYVLGKSGSKKAFPRGERFFLSDFYLISEEFYRYVLDGDRLQTVCRSIPS